jgi:hypothetical protein
LAIILRNIGKKKITGVSVTPLDDPFMYDAFLQVGDSAEIIKMKQGSSTTVGDIQPSHSRLIHIWTRPSAADWQFGAFKKSLRISADELDSLRMKFPWPTYLRSKYLSLLLVVVLVLVLSAIAGLYLQVVLLHLGIMTF